MGTRITGAEKVYAAAEQWVQRALRMDDSLFTPGARRSGRVGGLESFESGSWTGRTSGGDPTSLRSWSSYWQTARRRSIS